MPEIVELWAGLTKDLNERLKMFTNDSNRVSAPSCKENTRSNQAQNMATTWAQKRSNWLVSYQADTASRLSLI